MALWLPRQYINCWQTAKPNHNKVATKTALHLANCTEHLNHTQQNTCTIYGGNGAQTLAVHNN